jgi:parallel beta-helix repeat protein
MQKAKVMSLLIISLFFLSFSPAIIQAYGPLAPITVYVDDDYNPTTPGWGTDHFANIQDGIDAVATGGTVIVYAGTYDGITVNKEIILEGQGRDVVIIDGGGSGSVVTLASNHINISGFTITNGDDGIDLLSDYNIISLCKIENNAINGFYFEESDGNTIFYNDIVDNSMGMDLFDYENHDNLIYLNNFLNCTAIDDPPFGGVYNYWNNTYGTYPSGIIGGNYWYDYPSPIDVKHGTYPQSLSGSDGIADSIYTPGRSGTDYYPHMNWIYPPTLNTPPVISDEDPSNESIDIPVDLSQVAVLITDDGTFNWTIEGKYITSASGTDDTTGTKYASIPTTLPYFTNIKWYVNTTDGEFTVKTIFTFRTESTYTGTIQQAINNANAGDTVTIPSGYYTENIFIDKPLILRGSGYSSTTTLDGGGLNDVVMVKSNNVTIDGFLITNSGADTTPELYEYQNHTDVNTFGISSPLTGTGGGQSFLIGYLGTSESIHLDSIKVSLHLNPGINPLYNINVKLWESGDGGISPTQKGSTITIPQGNLVEGWNTIDFSGQSLTLFSRTYYGITLQPAVNIPYNQRTVFWNGAYGNPYACPGAVSQSETPSGWGTWNAGFDFAFQIWGYSTGQSAGITLSDNSSIVISNCKITGNDYAIHGDALHDVTIRDCVVSNNNYGIQINSYIPFIHTEHAFPSYGITIDGTTIENNSNDGMHVYADETDISKNKILYNANGIWITGNQNTITDNLIHDNNAYGIYVGWGTFDSNKITITGNTIWLNHEDGMIVLSSHNDTISENTIYSNWGNGITLMTFTSDSVVSNNNISGNDYTGLLISDCTSIRVYENDIYGMAWLFNFPQWQETGIAVQSTSANNKIYHNNLFDNQNNGEDSSTGPNIWNDSYPSGGNYWSDRHNDSQGAYDKFRGIHQSVDGADGIVDTPYSISGGSFQDIYPLRFPYRTIVLASADFTWVPYTPKKYQQVNFTSLSTGAGLVNWFWDFGDGSKSSGETASHNYSSIGYFSVRLTIINNRGLVDTSVKTIFVAPLGPFIPPIQPPKYTGYTVGEMYELLKADKLPTSNANINVFVIDSGVFPGTYNNIDLSKITELHASGLSSGVDENGHGSWTNYAIRYELQKLPNAHQYSYRIFDKNGDSTDAEFLQALDTAMRMNVDVVSISAGAIGNPSDQFSQKVAQLRSQGIFVFCAGGNFGPYTSTIISPGCSKYAVAVSAEDPQWTYDPLQREIEIKNLADDTICNWSSRGPVPNIYPKPDVTSPGESIIGPWVDNGFIIEKTVSGTSMATPLISGASAVIIAENKGLIDTVKTVHFWDKSIVVTAYEEALRDTCYKKGNVNDWGAGIAQFDKVSSAYHDKLIFALILSILEILIIPIIIIIALIYFFFLRGNKKSWRNFSKRTKSAWKGW